MLYLTCAQSVVIHNVREVETVLHLINDVIIVNNLTISSQSVFELVNDENNRAKGKIKHQIDYLHTKNAITKIKFNILKKQHTKI